MAAPLLALAGIAMASPAAAWDVSIGMNFLENGLYVESWSGPGFDWTTLDERIRASDQPGPTVPIVWTTQSWDGLAGEWPQADLTVSEGITQASLYNDDPTNEFWSSAEAFVFGPVASGDAVGAGVAYDFEFVVQPFTTGDLVLDSGETYVYLESEPGDVGNAFASSRLYLPDVDINDPGGSNMPLALDAYALAAGGAIVDESPTLSWSFQNATGSPETYHLRLEMSAAVFAVPEPGVAMALAAGGIGLAGLGRGKRRGEPARRPPLG
ncbi:MAG: hypothetical protein R3F35_08690 [Myxococcota bacterium]